MDRSPYIFDAGYATHPGRVRHSNEDAVLVRADVGLWAVADGMGGHDSGDLASHLIIQALDGISSATSAMELLAETESKIFEANRQIIEISRQRGGAVIGSTVAVLLISEDHYACVWAGDSRLYLVSNGAVRQVSRDHTEVEEMIASGAMTSDEARNWPQNVITKAVGVHENSELEVVTGAVEESNIFVLCSDGLTKHVSDKEILQQVSTGSAQSSCDALVDLALNRGGLDNITVVVVRPIQGTATSRGSGAIEGLPNTGIWE
ncbi:serine/threonine-protein phosphatase [Bradyrhizobium jicamae]|uniref:Serine/threonine-protein phosphatase n=1 Tax=Bradyrhizobium jicamae TaxID=280332 RepID=A0ABS5FVE4_9BRAD|nr:protein phosphatase 2C domain-containing protein [Bradyrhizobium jicamae]MBR0800708.1 serine/threonine-protein phosphatase [Bradyrhizobium jicamae]MBR0936624.1 serine/threonine-protein phosphatase [Bradyrhizobium jicamae]